MEARKQGLHYPGHKVQKKNSTGCGGFLPNVKTLLLNKQQNCRNIRCRVLSHAAAKSLQLCPTLCDPTDGSPPGSSVPGILQARILEWVAISFSRSI